MARFVRVARKFEKFRRWYFLMKNAGNSFYCLIGHRDILGKFASLVVANSRWHTSHSITLKNVSMTRRATDSTFDRKDNIFFISYWSSIVRYVNIMRKLPPVIFRTLTNFSSYAKICQHWVYFKRPVLSTVPKFPPNRKPQFWIRTYSNKVYHECASFHSTIGNTYYAYVSITLFFEQLAN